MLTWLTVGISLAAVVYLSQTVVTRLGSGRIQRFMDRRRASSQLVSRGELIDGNRHIPVALALTGSALYYESSDLQASLDLEWIGEVDYDDDIVTGHFIGKGKILTIRCYSQSFAFLIPIAALPQWQSLLPARRHTEPPVAPAADAHIVSNRELSRASDDGWPVEAMAKEAAV